jgi:hypothetical protein
MIDFIFCYFYISIILVSDYCCWFSQNSIIYYNNTFVQYGDMVYIIIMSFICLLLYGFGLFISFMFNVKRVTEFSTKWKTQRRTKIILWLFDLYFRMNAGRVYVCCTFVLLCLFCELWIKWNVLTIILLAMPKKNVQLNWMLLKI